VAKFFPELHLNAEGLWHWGRITKRMTFMNSAMLIALTLVVLNKYYVQKDITTRILNEKLSAELKLLKNQLHPHFFFNTLNNLYSLALQKSDLAPVMILKLSDLMRYTLDQADKEKVPLEEEIEFIKNYAAIEEIRYREKVTINWKIDINEPGILIPPLTLSTFIENAFKHAVAKARENITINISLSIINGYIQYTVINNLPVMKVESGKEIKKKEMGLNNLQHRLRLIYNDDFIFKTIHDSTYHAYLSIPAGKT
jgi:LytS/YehU family sensor histidine kinase